MTKNSSAFARVFLGSVGKSRRVEEFRKKQAIYVQGEPADSVMYIQRGSVKLTVVDESGKKAVVAIFASGDFFGEGALAGQKVRVGTATAIVPTKVLIIGKNEMIRALRQGTLTDRPLHQIHACSKHPS
jgi:CRP/FNR family cyclic AMP-dependent transcriptional regulator